MKRMMLAATLLLAVSFSATFGQTTNANLGGTVSDASNALIPGVTVTATNTQTGIVSTTITNETGAYNFPSLQTGIYKVSAELPGFQMRTYNDVALGVSQQVRLNFSLQVGGQTQSVEVSVAADTLLATTSSSVGAVLPEYKVRDLPLGTRNILDLVNTTPGVQGSGSNFAGGRMGQLNTTRDGIPVSEGRQDIGASTSTYVSPDLVDEVRVIVAPADAEFGRGSGQIQMSTRSGTNQIRGSVFWVNRNSKLNANSWNNNNLGNPKDYSNGNQYGVRVGGPIIKNKTFFFFLTDDQRFLTKSYFTGNVFTDSARNGDFRYFAGVQNANAAQNGAVVDRAGNPIVPPAQGGVTPTLTSFNVFGRNVNGTFTPWDVNRAGLDSSGWMSSLLSKMPHANDFTVGDGLNTAGFRWLRHIQGQDSTNGDGQDVDRDQYNFRIDHNLNSRHKAFFSGTWEHNWAEQVQAGVAAWPGGYNGLVKRDPHILSGSLVSTLSPTIVNEFRFGTRYETSYSWSPVYIPGADGDKARALLPTKGGVSFFPSNILFGVPSNTVVTDFGGASTRGSISPLWDYSDTLSWTKGKHAFKAGYDMRFTSSKGFNGPDNPSFAVFPSVTIGAGSTPVTGISTISGLIGSNVTTAQNLLLDLAGSVSAVSLTYNVHSPTDQTFTPPVRIKDYHQNEWSAFFKDDWKIRPDLTLNLGLRYDYYGVPWEASGMAALPVGGTAGLFGVSGTNVGAMWTPGANAGTPTLLQLVGKNSNHPNTQFYHDDWNNFGPAIGLSWSLPKWGKDKTVLRAGYGISYQGAAAFQTGLNTASGSNVGLSYAQTLTTQGLAANYYNLTTLPVPVASPTGIKPLTPEGFYTRSNPLVGFDDNRVNPYIQNYNLEIQRELANNLTLEVRYVGSKGSKLYGGISLNDVNIFENQILKSFNDTRAGLNAPLFDTMLNGLTLNAGTNASLGQGKIDGINVTGSAALRANSTFKTFLANGAVGSFANALNTSTLITGQAGGLVKNGGFPDNFITVNPQYGPVIMQTNPGSSTYHAMNLQVTKRLSHGFTNSFTYTWSKSLGEAAVDGNAEYLDPRNRRFNHTLLTFHRTQDLRSNGTLELPFGPGRKFLASGPGFLTRFVERWQLGGIFSWSSGAPLTLTASNASQITASATNGSVAFATTANTPNIVGPFPRNIGSIRASLNGTAISTGANYFDGYVQLNDPATVTTAQTLNTAVSNKGIAKIVPSGTPGAFPLPDNSGRYGMWVLTNSAPGTVGNLGRQSIEGPGHIGLNANLVKRVRIAEQKDFEIRIDAVNVLNTPFWGDPVVDINNASFGRMTAVDVTGANTADTRTGNRRFTLNLRLNF
jgi:hypothetical protein